MRVTLVISSLSVGGAERVLSTMANYWVAKDWDVTLITLSSASSDHYTLDPRVRRTALAVLGRSTSKLTAITGSLRRIRALRHAIRSAEASVVVSFGDRTNVVALLASLGMDVSVVVSERNDPRHHPAGTVWGGLRRLTYRRACMVVVQTTGLLPWASSHTRLERCCVIENPVRPDRAESPKPQGPKSRRVVLAVGRLVEQKGFDVLLRAFGEVAAEYLEWNLVILGDGPERTNLVALATELGISERFELPGFVRDPERLMTTSDLFVLSSHYEGFPNVLLEAMAHGMPVISTDCESGPSDIIRDHIDGILVPPGDVAEMSRAMSDLMGEEPRRMQLGENALAVRDRFQLKAVMAKWERVVEECQ